MAIRRRRGVSLALQGGGAHGAFGWGVLDRLLEDGRFRIDAISGASAGAMNAAHVAWGLRCGGPDSARAALEKFWRSVARASAPFTQTRSAWNAVLSGLGVEASKPRFAFLEALARMTSPYDVNPLNYHPLRDILQDGIDFEQLRKGGDIKLFIAATNVRSGQLRVFRENEISVDVLLASACLPSMFQAVEIGGDHYWDGGYTANPPLFPLVRYGAARDIVIVHLNPVVRAEAPTSADGILQRLNEITFNAPLLAELRALALYESERPKPGLLARIFTKHATPHRLHSISADAALIDLPAHSKLDTDWRFLTDLRDRGRAAAEHWISEDAGHVGSRSSHPFALPALAGDA